MTHPVPDNDCQAPPIPPIPVIGSLFSGCGGLDQAVTATTCGRVAWHCESDPAAAKVLSHHHPDTPNLGDIATVDWTAVAGVDVLTGGFPCQDISAAGRQAGMRPGTRSGLWSHMAYAVSVLRPRLVVIENVRNLLSVNAHGRVEPCPWCVGDRAEQCVRALGAVLADLADLGYDAAWCGLRASDVGAPHPRFRVFIAATDTTSPFGRPARNRAESANPQEWRPLGRAGRRGHHAVADAESQRQQTRSLTSGDASQRSFADSGGVPVVADAESQRWSQGRPEHAREFRGLGLALSGDAAAPQRIDWGDYEPAIRRWETILGRPAPTPTVAGRRGGQQLNAVFVEWMMGLRAGHVTLIPGLSRNDMLRILGNGVVPQQGRAALEWLLTRLPAPQTRHRERVAA